MAITDSTKLTASLMHADLVMEQDPAEDVDARASPTAIAVGCNLTLFCGVFNRENVFGSKPHVWLPRILLSST